IRDRLDTLARAALDALHAEVDLRRGEVERALETAERAFAEIRELAASDVKAPALVDVVGHVTYTRVLGHVRGAASSSSTQDPPRAGEAFDEGRALRIELSLDRDDRGDRGAIGLHAARERVVAASSSRHDPHVIRCAFLWDNRSADLGVFIVGGDA